MQRYTQDGEFPAAVVLHSRTFVGVGYAFEERRRDAQVGCEEVIIRFVGTFHAHPAMGKPFFLLDKTVVVVKILAHVFIYSGGAEERERFRLCK